MVLAPPVTSSDFWTGLPVLLEAPHTTFDSSATGFLNDPAEPDGVEISRALTGFVTPAGQ